MSRSPKTPSRMEVLVLSCLAQAPRHGYEIKRELEQKHVQWWAKCEHGHLYAALTRLEKHQLIQREEEDPPGRRRVHAITDAGRSHLAQALVSLGKSEDTSYFDVDLFLSGAALLDLDQVLGVLHRREAVLSAQLKEAESLRDRVFAHLPPVGRLVLQHRLQHLEQEIRFALQAVETLETEALWGRLGPGQSQRSLTSPGVPASPPDITLH